MPSTITITALGTSVPTGQRVYNPATDVNTADSGETLVVALASGDNTFTVPAGATQVIIAATGTTPPTATLKLRTSLNSGDAGIPFNQQSPLKYPFPTTAPTTLIINASQAQSSPTLSLWFN